LFSCLTKEELNSILEPIDMYCYPPDSVLYHEGDHNESVYTLRTGLVKLVRILPDGTFRIVRLLRKGDAFGLERLIGENYEHTALTITGVSLCRIPVPALSALSGKSPRLHRRLLERWDQHLRRADDIIVHLSTGTIRKRIVYLVQMLADSTEDENDKTVKLLSREDMAAMLGVRLESLSRIIAELKRKHILRPLGKDIYEYDIVALSQYVKD
jgi:CRP/FNR family transcriptional regulator